jgi:Acyl CoA:acetate/3-ketoacid CoA transferase, alpha subunit
MKFSHISSPSRIFLSHKTHVKSTSALLKLNFSTLFPDRAPATAGCLEKNPQSSKLVSSAKEALSDCIFPGARINCGSFGLGGLPETLLHELAKSDHARELTVASLTANTDGFGLGKLVEAGKVKRLIASYVGENDHVAEMYFTGKLEVELIPQGTIAARMRAAGSGIPAFYTPAGVGELRCWVASC